MTLVDSAKGFGYFYLTSMLFLVYGLFISYKIMVTVEPYAKPQRFILQVFFLGTALTLTTVVGAYFSMDPMTMASGIFFLTGLFSMQSWDYLLFDL